MHSKLCLLLIQLRQFQCHFGGCIHGAGQHGAASVDRLHQQAPVNHLAHRIRFGGFAVHRDQGHSHVRGVGHHTVQHKAATACHRCFGHTQRRSAAAQGLCHGLWIERWRAGQSGQTCTTWLADTPHFN